MSRIRDIASILTSANVLSTDVETSAAITAAINALPPGYGRGNTASRPVSPTVGDIYVNTQTGFVEIYESTGWSQVGGIASTVTGVTATNSPSGRAYNNGATSITFTPGSVLGKTYVVTSSPGSYTASGTASPITITGLQSSTQYTYTVVASNNYGTASASSASSAVTATTVPQAPTIGTATGGNAQASVTFTANATGGSAITGYTITSSPGNITASGATSPIVVTGLTNSTAYTFTAVATNANGSSAASSASNSVTPASTVSVDFLLVAGGGAGGNWFGGGGGGGGVRSSVSPTGGSGNVENKLQLTLGVAYTVTVGAGAASNGDSSNQTTGEASSISGLGFTTISAAGGGSGGSRGPNAARNPSSGGCGGGGGANGFTAGGAASPSGQGFGGGTAADYSWASAGGGGGGAGAVGNNAGNSAGGGGGAGITNNITGSNIVYSDGGNGGYGNGSVGGNPGGSSQSGSATKGAGGGGGNSVTGSAGGANGGGGRVVIKAQIAATSTTGNPSNPSLGIYIFDGTGSITF